MATKFKDGNSSQIVAGPPTVQQIALSEIPPIEQECWVLRTEGRVLRFYRESSHRLRWIPLPLLVGKNR